MRMPVDYIGIVRGFSSSHFGVDFGYHKSYGGANIPIFAVEDGIVNYKVNQTKGGKTIGIYHEKYGLTSIYGHMETWYVNKNDKVKKGQMIGLMGGTGVVSGNHLHFAFYKGNVVNFNNKAGFIDSLPLLCAYKGQVVGSGTKIKWLGKINYTKFGVGIYDPPLNVRDKNNKIVDGIVNGQETEYFGKDKNKRAIVNKYLNYTTIDKYLK